MNDATTTLTRAGHVKVRYRGLAKNTAQFQTLFALANPRKVRNRLSGSLA